MTQEKLRKIFDEAGEEVVKNFDVEKISQDFAERLKIPQLTDDDGKALGEVVAVFLRLNQDFLFRVLTKVLCHSEKH